MELRKIKSEKTIFNKSLFYKERTRMHYSGQELIETISNSKLRDEPKQKLFISKSDSIMLATTKLIFLFVLGIVVFRVIAESYPIAKFIFKIVH
jgi:hypothetical protein